MFRRIRQLIILGFAVSIATPLFAQAPKKYALLVAVTTYEHTYLNQAPKIQFPEADATAIAAELKASDYIVETLLGQDAKFDAINGKLEGLARKGNEPGVIIIGFFGHGVEYDEKDSDGKPTSRSYFCPYDATMRNRLDEKGRETFDSKGKPRIEPDPKSLIAMASVFGKMALSPAGNRLLLADCCRNDPHAARGRGFGTGVKTGDLPENANTAVLFACSKGERAFEDPVSKHGAFTSCVLDWLKNPGERPTAGNLGEHLDEAVPRLVANLSNGDDRQKPRYLNVGKVDLFLTRGGSTNLPKLVVSKSTGMKLTLVSNGTQSFYMGVFEVTQAEYEIVMKTNPSSFSKSGNNRDKVRQLDTTRFPVENVSWYDAIEFCNKLSEKDNLPVAYVLANIQRDGTSIKFANVRVTGEKGYRLPTESEWEFACSAGTSSDYSFGNDSARLGEFAWFAANTTQSNEAFPHTVGTKSPNSWGFFDMHGNVWEWCVEDSTENDRPYRGGSWMYPAPQSKTTSGGVYEANSRFNDLGFRIVAPSSKLN